MDLTKFNWILINTSAGKDSQAMMHIVVEAAIAQGVLDRVIAIHCDLGRVEWKGTHELAGEHAAHYGIPIEYVSRPQGDLLAMVRERGMWMGPATPYCTSGQKRDQVKKVFTRLGKEHRADGNEGPVQILNCMGMRADESPARKKQLAVRRNPASNGRKEVTDWLPVHEYTADGIWATIAEAGTRHHEAYDLGMPRLSCVFCINACPGALQIAGEANPELLAEYAALETEIGHQFVGEPGSKNGISLVELVRRIEAGEERPALRNTWGSVGG